MKYLEVFLLFLNSLLVASLEVKRLDQDEIYSVSKNCSLCLSYRAKCTSRHYVCKCMASRSTFVFSNKTCMDVRTLVRENDCLTRIDGRLDILTLVNMIGPSTESRYKLPIDVTDCSPVQRGFYYLQRTGHWGYHKLESSSSNFFTARSNENSSNDISIQIKGHSDLDKFSGHIIRLNLLCNTSGKAEQPQCILLKAKGKISDTSPTLIPTTGNQTTVKKTSITSNDIPSIDTKTNSQPTSIRTVTRVTTSLVGADGIASIDDDNDQDDVMMTSITIVAVIVSVILIGLLVRRIVRYHRRRILNDTNVTGLVVENGHNNQGAITMWSVPGSESEHVYSELNTVVKETNIKHCFPSTTSLNTINEDSCIVRNTSVYNTMPKARKNTDPLPVIPLHETRPRTLEPRNSFMINACADNTNTAKFLDEVSRRGCMSLNRYVGKKRERSWTDVDVLDDVFFSDAWRKLSLHEDDRLEDNDDNERGRNRSESFYQQLQSHQSHTTLYESLQDATKESPTTRQSTLERMRNKTINCEMNNNDDRSRDSEREYHTLEPSQDIDAASELSSCGDWPEMPVYHTLEGPEKPYTCRDSIEATNKEPTLKMPYTEQDTYAVCRKKAPLRRCCSERVKVFKKEPFKRSLSEGTNTEVLEPH